MYRPSEKIQHSFHDFNQPMGLQMNPNNRWIKMADCIPWDEFEIKYAELFPSDTGNVAKPLRMALGALIIQTKFQYADRELVEQITENPYLQYFIGLPGYQDEAPFDASTLVLFRKRISAEMLMEANEYLLAHKDDDKNNPTPPSAGGSDDDTSKEENKGTLTLDATCAPANIRYPQDISLLNEARKNWKPSFTVFVNPMVFRCQDVIANVPEKTILHLQKVKNTVQSKSARHSASSLVTWQEISGIWMNL